MTDATAAAPAADIKPTAPVTTTGAADKAASGVSGARPTLATGGTTPVQAPAATAPAPATAAPAPTTSTEPAAETTWRDRLAGDDKELRKRLDRFADEKALVQSYREMERKFSSGEYKPAPQAYPDKGTAEEQAQWRKTFGVPDKPEEYVEKIALPNGVVLGEADKPVATDFAAFAHGKNWSPQQYNDALTWYYGHLDKITAARDEADEKRQIEARDALRDGWGARDFTRNINAVHNLIATWPPGLGDRVMGGRTADGRLLGDDPDFIRLLAQTSLDLNPAASVLIAGSGEGSSIETELQKIREVAKTDPDKYDRDHALQARQRELLDAQARTKSRGRAA